MVLIALSAAPYHIFSGIEKLVTKPCNAANTLLLVFISLPLSSSDNLCKARHAVLASWKRGWSSQRKYRRFLPPRVARRQRGNGDIGRRYLRPVGQPWAHRIPSVLHTPISMWVQGQSANQSQSPRADKLVGGAAQRLVGSWMADRVLSALETTSPARSIFLFVTLFVN